MNMMGIRSFSPLRQWMARRGWIGVSPVNRLTLIISGDVAPRTMGKKEARVASSYHDFAASRTMYSDCRHNMSCLLMLRTWRPALIEVGVSKNGLHPSRQDINYRFYGRNNRIPDFRVCESFDDVLQLALEHLDQLRPKEVAVVWSNLSRTLLKKRLPQPNMSEKRSYKVETTHYELQLVDHILERTFSCLDEMSPKDVTTIILAMAKIVKRIRNNPQKKCNAAQQAFRNVFFDETLSLNESIFYDLTNHSNRILPRFEARDLSNLAYAHALLEYDPEFDDGSTLLAKIADESIGWMNKFNAQDISNMAWAYATLEILNQELFVAMGNAVSERRDLNEFKPQALSNIVWAFSTANVHHPNLFQKIGDNVASMKDLKSFKPQELSNIVWAFATANVHHPGLFKIVGDNIDSMKDLKSFNGQDFANIVWAYATANVHNPNLFRKIGDHIAIMKDFKSFQPQALSNIVWAYATANVDAPSLFGISFIEALEDNKPDLIAANCRQLYQWHLWQTQELSKAGAGLPVPFQQKCYQAFTSADTTDSALQRDVVTQLDSMGLNPVEEYLTNSGYSVDALIEIDGKKVGVELDGPSHFIGRRPNGSTALKHRQVVAIDKIPLVSVPYWEWDKLKKDRNKKQQYLESLLESAKLSRT